MTVDVYSMVYNEEYLLPHYFKFYKDKFKDISFKLYDNGSTDRTREIAEQQGVVVEHIETGDQIRDDILLKFKNEYWKNSTADWIIVCDIDEWVDVDPFHMREGISHFVSEGYDMIGEPDTVYGVRNPLYDKVNIFNRRLMKDINYSVGAHLAYPNKSGVASSHRPKMYHMRYPSEEQLISRYKVLNDRLSDLNKQNGWCHQYKKSENDLRGMFWALDLLKTKVR